MSEPNDAERRLLEVRSDNLDQFLADRMPVLVDFVRRLDLPDASMVLQEAERYLPALDEWLQEQDVGPDDRTWLILRVGYYVGEYLIQRRGGYWLLDDIPGTRFFGRYVVRLSRVDPPGTMVDVFGVAADLADEPRGRSLAAHLQRLEADMGASSTRGGE